ncbi:MAG: hypothetical protein ABI852_10630 [Gemmatimonadaceae bacterium]
MSVFGDSLDNFLDIFFGKARDAKIMARVAEEKRLRLAAMANDPVRRKYVERIQRGEYWSDEEIDFNEDPNASDVCEHLRPIEMLMREQKIDVRPVYPKRIRANCLVDPEKLGIGSPPVVGVAYLEVHVPDRSMLDPRSAMITCSICNSYIDVVHSDVATPDTPWFPR